MKLFILFLLVLSILLTASDKPHNPLEMRREVLARTKRGRIECSVIHDAITNSYFGLLINIDYYPHGTWVYKQLSNEEAKHYYDSFYPWSRGTYGS